MLIIATTVFLDQKSSMNLLFLRNFPNDRFAKGSSSMLLLEKKREDVGN
ncbi:hypothetical protein HMPREF9087_0980 [Enterococcus casseliflavus ATCC 12755]|uniref:Uncharacterized protein n=1 Tax=Enterococcus casseliflavus ATCC 12755 TaxID=888066 RepID=F0EHT8_ENTCA|nr:hypothetical protein HMPREF9087_0980 [Enterococcus casseliflavus ATCC 12755]